ncbi:ABC transporter ATP-binding protein [Streptomyces alkaliterrae]|uniref:ABC transporter ATP-binding protein n=1 Tax=Streptomyces alkaliterrae TaxID=2213162 RepID=A0A5P0YZJ8_9ACTN|nr:ABC transporter ATP-binding protein [Streptomyces alkaliterrae]MBB1255036.1 ABC transporter ATP-binding protein [Streptomyces alkaliterrae]MBB1261243.1 ABC transporter ATP-binding protein [Streptomyces alkaliterrae]MQS04029.1 ATP-binding cassette domain-containing protein [Streptomyces alkaliterrae]
MTADEQPAPAADGVPAQRSKPLGPPPARLGSGPDDGDLTDELKEAYWSVYDGAAANATLGEILVRLPRIVRRVGELAWRADRRATVALVVLQLGSAAMSAFGLMASVAVLHQLFGEGPTPDRVRAAVPQILLVVAFLAARALLEAGVSLTQAHVTPKIRTALEREFLQLTAHVRLEVVDDADWHDDAYRAHDRGLFYARQIVGQVVALASAALGILGTAGVLAALHPLLIALLPLSVLPVGAAAIRSARARFHSFRRWNALQRRVRLFSWLLLDRDSAAELRSDTAQRALLDEHHRITARIAEEDTRLGVHSAKLALTGRALGGVGTGVTYVVLALMLVAGWMPLAAGAGAVLAIQAAQGSLTRFMDVAHLVYEHAMWVDDLLAFQERCRSLQPRRHGSAAPGKVAEIELRDVSYTYPGKEAPALNGVSMTLRAGETVAFVGVNGSGKSTCSKVIAGLYDPGSGAVCWDGADTAGMDAESLQNRVSMVLQDPLHYPFSALANITASRGTLTEAEPRQALDAVTASGADQVIAQLPQKWRTLLSKRFKGGQELSAGQWAKIAVARGLYKDAPVLLLDEPTASMDPKAEHAVYQAVLRNKRRAERITVLISHRLASVVECDRIYVFDAGRIVESGTHDELMARGGDYAEMFTLQADAYQAGTGAAGH